MSKGSRFMERLRAVLAEVTRTGSKVMISAFGPARSTQARRFIERLRPCDGSSAWPRARPLKPAACAWKAHTIHWHPAAGCSVLPRPAWRILHAAAQAEQP